MRAVFLPDDENFLTELYFSTREDLAALPIGVEQINVLLQIQYAAQKQQYQITFPDARREVVLFENQSVGQLTVARDENSINLIDISLLPQYRNLRIGTFLLQSLLNEAADTKRMLTFSVLKTNRALRLYLRFGFLITGETASHYLMESAKF